MVAESNAYGLESNRYGIKVKALESHGCRVLE
jgi:hypothetical protein